MTRHPSSLAIHIHASHLGKTVSVYLDSLHTKYDGLRAKITDATELAVAQGRDLEPDELRAIEADNETAKGLLTQIEAMTAIEVRNQQVDATRAKVAPVAPKDATDDGGKTDDTQTRSVGATTTRDRDPGHYRSVEDGGKNSFFADLFHARVNQDGDALQRLAEHTRALATGAAGSGIVPPKWLVDEYAPLARQGRMVANSVRRIPLTDPAPLTLPKQTVGSDTEVTEQATEGDAIEGDDQFDTDVDTVAPKPTAGKQVVTRQMIDSTNPAVDILIYGDLLAAYNTKIEAKVCAALLAAAGTTVATMATEAAFDTNLAGVDAVVDTALAVRRARKLPANFIASNIRRYGEFLKMKDSTGRPLMPDESGGPMNVVGVGSVDVDGRLKGLGYLPTDGIAETYAESTLIYRGSDTLLFEGNTMRFRYEEKQGPEKVELGIWAYTAVLVRYSGSSVKRFVVTAAS